MSVFYNIMQRREISTRPNWISDRKSWRYKPRATLCVFSHANIETTRSKGVHCSISDAW